MLNKRALLCMNSFLKNALLEASDHLSDAKYLLSGHRYDACINRSYYAYFWILRGLLMAKEVTAKTHAGVHQKFGELYVKTGEIPLKFNDYLSEIAQKRITADYEINEHFEYEDAEKTVKQTEEFLNYVKDHFPPNNDSTAQNL